MSKTRFFTRLFVFFTGTLFLAFILSYLFLYDGIRQMTYRVYTQQLIGHIEYLKTQDQLRSDAVELMRYADAHHVRLTLIDAEGTVLFDSEKDPSSMENHANREEVLEAKDGDLGVSHRYSNTLKLEMLYVAAEEEGIILRIAIPIDYIHDQTSVTLVLLGMSFIIIVFGSMVVVYRLTRAMTLPLQNLTVDIERFARDASVLEQDKPLTHNEVSLLRNSFENMTNRITRQMNQLRYLEQYRQEFVANISHELRTPLTSIVGYLETLEQSKEDDAVVRERFMKNIMQNVKRLQALVEDILKLSKIENETRAFDPVDMTELFKTLVADQDLQNHKEIKLAIPGEAIPVEGNRHELYSAMMNYVENALKYATVGPIEIRLRTAADQVWFEVEDHGPGISEENLSRLFERFYRPDKSRSRRIGGTGLGLAIVKHIAEKHGGESGVESQVGEGSRFYFWIPLSESS